MKICVWSSSSFEKWYSSYHLMLELLQAMLKEGHEVWLVQMQTADGCMPSALENQEKLHVINYQTSEIEKGSFPRRYMEEIKYYVKSSKIIKNLPEMDVIFLQSTNAAIIPVWAAKRMKIPVLYNVQDIFPMDALVVGKIGRSNPVYLVTRWMQAQAYKIADRVVTISEDLAKTIREEGRQQVDVVYNWSYQNDPYAISDNHNHFLQSYGIKREDGFRVIYAGNIGQMMEFEVIIESARILRNYKDIKFYIIGEGSNLARFKARVQEEKLDNILFYDRQPMEYAQDNYCAADVNINPVPKGVMYTCMPSKTATCLLSEKATVVSMDLDSDMAQRLSKVDRWKVVAPGDGAGMAEAILDFYQQGHWDQKSTNSADFLKNLGPVENALEYVKILEKMAR